MMVMNQNMIWGRSWRALPRNFMTISILNKFSFSFSLKTSYSTKILFVCSYRTKHMTIMGTIAASGKLYGTFIGIKKLSFFPDDDRILQNLDFPLQKLTLGGLFWISRQKYFDKNDTIALMKTQVKRINPFSVDFLSFVPCVLSLSFLE